MWPMGLAGRRSHNPNRKQKSIAAVASCRDVEQIGIIYTYMRYTMRHTEYAAYTQACI